MTQKAMDRAELKRACMAALDEVALEHPSGHQAKLAARYVLRTPRGEAIEIMFEKGPRTPANLWMSRDAGEALFNAGLRYRHSPATDTNATADTKGRPRYGRHSALKPMRQLANADLICFTIERQGEIEQLLRGLLAR